MQASQLLTADLLDILFDGKNKAYGAYQLRKTYNDRLLRSLLIVLLLLVLMIFSYFFSSGNKTNDPMGGLVITDSIHLSSLPEPAPVVPPAAPTPAAPVKTIAHTTISIVPDLLVTEDNDPPVMEDLDKMRIGRVSTDGVDSDGAIPPVSSVNGVSTGVVDAPLPSGTSGEEGFIPIEKESQYPGGLKAWSRFLYRSLGNNYPGEAYEKGIEGTVMIQFIVDKDGTVSNVEAVSGPAELREAAITVIRKSGRWEPALQNGRHVKSYKRQPITFMIQPD